MVRDFVIEDYEAKSASGAPLLDQFSTSPTHSQDLCFSHRCAYNAPKFAVERSAHRYSVVQGCCNHWDCPRCGIQVARGHYGRIVEGARKVYETSDLWFITITCRGKDVSREEALRCYLAWSSKFLDACYSDARRKEKEWYYVQVTELQKRGHPHSHILTSFYPDGLYLANKRKWSLLPTGKRQYENKVVLRSDFLARTVSSAGLGEEYDISIVRSIEAASRYVAKYMFKDSQFSAQFPKHWKRVRYSQSWPDLERKETTAFVLLSREDWNKLADIASVVDAEEGAAFEDAEYFLRNQVKVIEVKARDNERKRNVGMKGNETVS